MYYKENTLLFKNGKWIKASEAVTSVFDQTLHYGNGVFEGIRSYETEDGTKIFKAEEHFERLLYSAKKMHIKVGYSVEELIDITYELLEKNNLSNAYIRPLFYLGPNMSLSPTDEVNLVIAAWEWAKYLGENQLKVCVSTYTRPHPSSCHIEAKTVGHYTNSILATTEAKQKGFDEALMLDVNGYVAEAPGANFFWEKDGVLYTAPRGHILPGITRQTIIELAEDLGLELRQKFASVSEIKQADGAFFTGTAAEVIGLKSLDEYEFPIEWEKSLGKELAQMYQLRVAKREYKNFELV